MLTAQGRHPWRPAHVHFMIVADGYEKLVTHIFLAGDKYLDSDVVFGVKDSLIENLEEGPAGGTRSKQINGRYWVMSRDFRLQRSSGERIPPPSQ
jgi:hydroxyquinol 1,2-dioxygenase